ncbi:MAG: DUF1565 domain-containing protein [Candidatus Schekmanbacteria bacterium]|nr:MAG: DUF1565 domain-containing protein [Candidatus Schekmanbacteria bacterium]
MKIRKKERSKLIISCLVLILLFGLNSYALTDQQMKDNALLDLYDPVHSPEPPFDITINGMKSSKDKPVQVPLTYNHGGVYRWKFRDPDGDTQKGWEYQNYIKEPDPSKFSIHGYYQPGADKNAQYSGRIVAAPEALVHSNIYNGSEKRTPIGTNDGFGITATRGALNRIHFRVFDGVYWSKWSDFLYYRINMLPSAPILSFYSTLDTKKKEIFVFQQAPLKRSKAFPLMSFFFGKKGRIYHVAVTGSDSNSGKEDKPFKTITYAASLAGPGDTVIVHAGTYNEQIQPNSGLKGAPITFMAAEGEDVIIDGTGLDWGFNVIKTSGISYVIIKGFKFQNQTRGGINLQRAFNIIVEDNYFNNCGKTAVRFQEWGANSRIINNVIENTGIGIGAIELRRHTGVEVIGNDVSKYTYGGIYVGGEAVGCVIKNNVIHDSITATGLSIGSAIYNYDAFGTRIENNLIYNISAHDGIMIWRSNNVVIYNNTIFNILGTGRAGINASGFELDIRNNIISNAIFGIRAVFNTYTADEDKGPAINIDYNCIHRVKFPMNDDSAPEGKKRKDIKGEGNIFKDPLFKDPKSGDFTLLPASPCIDAGDPSFPVYKDDPGSRRDMGYAEYLPSGSSSDFVPAFSTDSKNVYVCWQFKDPDNNYGYDNYQTHFQIQIDRTNSFDSENLYDSGIIESSKNCAMIPSIYLKEKGLYYIRIRTSDNLEPDIMSMWSDLNTAFEIK